MIQCMKEYRLRWTEIEEIAIRKSWLSLYSDCFIPITISWRTMCSVYYRRTIAIFMKYNERSRENKISEQCGRDSQFRAIRDEIGSGWEDWPGELHEEFLEEVLGKQILQIVIDAFALVWWTWLTHAEDR